MSKKCEISGTGVMSGNNVSHANNKTRRRFLPNLQVVSLLSEKLGKVFKLKICSKTLRSIEHNGGLDAYLESTSNSKLSAEAVKIKKQISKAQSKTIRKLFHPAFTRERDFLSPQSTKGRKNKHCQEKFFLPSYDRTKKNLKDKINGDKT